MTTIRSPLPVGEVTLCDEALFAQAQQGDQTAFALLVQRYQHRVYSVALRLLRQPQAAQDATQHALLHAWQQRHTWHPDRRVRPWLYRIVTNRCVDLLRQQQRCPLRALDDFPALPTASTPEQEYTRQECRQALDAALLRLPVEARIVLVLCYVEGLSYREIASARGITVETVKSQLQRAKALMRQHLATYREEQP